MKKEAQSKIIHLTSVHPRFDVRILSKECASLAKEGYVVYLVVADGRGSESKAGVTIEDVGLPGERGRLARMTRIVWRVYKKALLLNGDVYHLHDPELIPVGFCLTLRRKKIVYDVHEDLPRKVMDKYWLPGVLRWPVSIASAILEWWAGRCFAAIVAATGEIARRFPRPKTIVVQNFPQLSELKAAEKDDYRQRKNDFVYLGVLSEYRGVLQMVKAIALVPQNYKAVLTLAGNFSPASLKPRIQEEQGWKYTRFLAWVDREDIGRVLNKARAGLVLMHPTKSFVQAYPIKLFEYMAAGIPVIASDFPLWRSIVDDAACGLLVNPLDPWAIAEAIQWILDNPDQAWSMGRNGRRAVEDKFTWDKQEKALLRLYSMQLSQRA